MTFPYLHGDMHSMKPPSWVVGRGAFVSYHKGQLRGSALATPVENDGCINSIQQTNRIPGRATFIVSVLRVNAEVAWDAYQGG